MAQHTILPAASRAADLLRRDLPGQAVTAGQLLILLVAASTQGLSLVDIADAARVDWSYCGRLVRRLQARGLVSRRRSTTSARAKEVKLTKRGWAALAVVAQLSPDITQDLEARRPEGSEEFLAYLRLAAEALPHRRMNE
jgi:DNA-binding MarR family transcriptional regulator